MVELVESNLNNDPFAKSRAEYCAQFHPYTDGKSTLRMVETVKEYLKTHPVPEKRK